jgi:hypothetical protein
VPRQRGPTRTALAIALGCTLVVLAVVVALVWRPGADAGSDRGADSVADSDPAGPPSSADLRSPLLLAEDTEYVETRVLDGGDLLVTHWIHAAEPMNQLMITVPASPGLDDRAIDLTHLVVAADGEQVDAPGVVDLPAGWAGSLPAAQDVYVQYELSGITQRSDSAEGRGIALLTSADLEVDRPILSRSQTFSGAHVLTVACLAPGEQAVPRPCGHFLDNTWNVTSEGAAVDELVIAQFDLP